MFFVAGGAAVRNLWIRPTATRFVCVGRNRAAFPYLLSHTRAPTRIDITKKACFDTVWFKALCSFFLCNFPLNYPAPVRYSVSSGHCYSLLLPFYGAVCLRTATDCLRLSLPLHNARSEPHALYFEGWGLAKGHLSTAGN